MDREFVSPAVSQNGHVLQYAAEESKANRESVLAAVSQIGHAFRFAAQELRRTASQY